MQESPLPQWWLMDRGKSTGPFSYSQLVDAISDGRVSPKQLAMQSGTPGWKSLTEWGLPVPNETMLERIAASSWITFPPQFRDRDRILYASVLAVTVLLAPAEYAWGMFKLLVVPSSYLPGSPEWRAEAMISLFWVFSAVIGLCLLFVSGYRLWRFRIDGWRWLATAVVIPWTIGFCLGLSDSIINSLARPEAINPEADAFFDSVPGLIVGGCSVVLGIAGACLPLGSIAWLWFSRRRLFCTNDDESPALRHPEVG